ncbi:acyl-CoA:6-aminopenicillanic-acid-acyltransferase, putative [Talaromyces stipitatus ATCC 10500]|uniref:Acyl-CoA:6-aminopenicillanic-acid-acyltransferase, putative n=1 Tax=Talaromyces stipitatus (strain ATCC 10500 / CBS 375.48 / QM 6759 / NRRL 1006) TaxID=441959 RepID=B8MHH5_TALSN|nr:acyl-CoA:6-aminopenicillanic-acid-acyltransferase, putative [Talaromyces stipitatus ATCC 10500]EED15956.1 acyl-CoA:6-aminopenicillanic-acid-acyltransferase, putative [Talaromyces stipitatus ATCC 10500]
MRQIGKQHGTAAKDKIIRCIGFYAELFQRHCHLSWSDVRTAVRPFEENVKKMWPNLHEEMKGVADGSAQSLVDIVALNVRTEIAFGKFSDGCTSLAWLTKDNAFLGQNWDWQEKQRQNLILLKITQPNKPIIRIMTEAGIIGKIGYNHVGVGVCLNALRAPGVDPNRLPVHLALRLSLECSSASDAVQMLEKWGVASSAHMLIADKHEAFGVETSAKTMQKILRDGLGRIIHSNHFLLPHPGVVDTKWLEDSPFRVDRMRELTDELNDGPAWDMILKLFEDERNSPASICRYELGSSTFGTLFNIVMDLKGGRVVVRMGKPSQVEEVISMTF